MVITIRSAEKKRNAIQNQTQKIVDEIMKETFYSVLLHWCEEHRPKSMWCYFLSQVLTDEQLRALMDNFNVYIVQPTILTDEDKEIFNGKDDHPFEIQLSYKKKKRDIMN